MVRLGYKSLALLSLLLVAVSGCDTGSGDAAGTGVEIKPPAASDQVVCTPFNGGDPSLPYNGLAANLYYLSDDQPRYSNIGDVLANAHKADVTLFLNRLDTPTRPFDQGFVTQAGSTVMNQNGNTLYEYFAIHSESFLKLREGDAEGDYQLALLADDGAILQINDAGTFRKFVDDDGTHPTKMSCATEPLHMDRTTLLPIKVDYYQGPRFHIALTMIWRPWNAATANDPLCNQSGNSTFWDSTTTPSTPTGYAALQSRGWKALNTENYRLPASMNSNPCAQTTEITLTNIRIVNVTQTSATFQWDTNVASDSTVIVTPSGGSPAATFDGTPVVSHSVTVNTLTSNTFYSFYVTSAAGGSSASNAPSTFRTLR